MKVAIVVGHSSKDPGSINTKFDVTEFEIAKQVAECVYQDSPIPAELVFRDTYRELPGKINALYPDFIISMHCNAFNGSANGTEVLYYHKSRKSKKLARILQKNLVNALELPDRGIKAKSRTDRGGYLLKYTNAPCVIAEPFFIDNNKDLQRALERQDRLVDAYVKTIRQYADFLSGKGD